MQLGIKWEEISHINKKAVIPKNSLGRICRIAVYDLNIHT